MWNNIESYQIRKNNTLGDIENSILEARRSANETYRNLQNKINTNTENVAMTAFLPSDVRLIVGSLVQFSDVKFSAGMGNMIVFKRTGKFICEKEGLYIISVTILTVTNAGEFYLYVNGSIFATSYKYQSNAWWSSSSIIISLELQVNDSVWIQTNGIQVRGGSYSHLTIVKLK
ncbi:unnamed protein product [Mytilus coruscus]|uniref:C1q domain-containing protein n=1 Tax=Mytilus coruscus TaxID=42192 RepID=A0A6J8EQL0_MYTCO|nr:unnamed protein product [Mytilus coruscus]